MSGPNSNFNIFIERYKDYWESGTEVPTGEIIQNGTDKQNGLVSAKELINTDPNDTKFLALPTRLSKLDKAKVMSLQHSKGEEAT